MFTTFPWSYLILSCFKQLPLNSALVLVPKQLNSALSLKSLVVGAVIFSSENPLNVQN